ncbi:RidA family protein [Streptomyces sp. AJS327]|uniref:RidA family protein n=1 Tax=Streptomyces sp. AJS327 TaxID=2545265 RepID=UPI0015DE551D|nr:RidA family protein [Streptomyces sp. AJS327]MBA0052723.1 RidA family protein [Streptomyces sp. AJS327]
MSSHIARFNPEGLHETPGYHHITVVEAGRTAHLSGQCPLDLAGEVVGGADVVAQTDQVVANCRTALAAVGAAPEHVVRSVIYVREDARGNGAAGDGADAGGSPRLDAVWERLTSSPLGPAFSTASTILGVSSLGYPGQLVEIDLTVALPPRPQDQPLTDQPSSAPAPRSGSS